MMAYNADRRPLVEALETSGRRFFILQDLKYCLCDSVSHYPATGCNTIPVTECHITL